MKKIVIIIILLSSLTACSQKTHKNYYKYNGKDLLIEEGRFDKQKRKIGKWTKYYQDLSDTTKTESNKIRSITTYINGIKNGKYQEFYPNGQLKREGKYKDDKIIGIWNWYSKDGILGSTKTFKDDFAIFIFFDSNGKIIQRKEFKKSIITNEYYYSDGQIRETTIQNLEDKTKKYKSFFKNGKLKKKGDFKNGKKIGKWKQYYLNSGIQTIEDYINELSYQYLFYHTNGNLLVVGQYVDGERNGVWKHFDNKKKLSELNTFDKGVLNGWSESYHFNGKLEKKGNYKNGKKNGEWRYYDIYGSEKKLIMYKNGEEVYSESIIGP